VIVNAIVVRRASVRTGVLFVGRRITVWSTVTRAAAVLADPASPAAGSTSAR
jgi:hypothetical protein